MQPTTTYPLLFDCKAKLFESIELRVQGQAVVTVEDDGDGPYYLAHGLRPGGISGIGVTLEEAYRDMERTMLCAIAVRALEADSERSFEAEIERFFYRNHSKWAADSFEAAREAVRTGKINSHLEHRPSTYSLEISGWRKIDRASSDAPEGPELPSHTALAA